jgi:hypothetical protein
MQVAMVGAIHTKTVGGRVIETLDSRPTRMTGILTVTWALAMAGTRNMEGAPSQATQAGAALKKTGKAARQRWRQTMMRVWPPSTSRRVSVGKLLKGFYGSLWISDGVDVVFHVGVVVCRRRGGGWGI